jgi:hypothetical protein
MNLQKCHIPVETSSQQSPAIAVPALISRLGGIAALALMLLLAGGAQAQGVFAAWQNLGTSATQTVKVTATASGTVSKVEVLTGGASGLEFTSGGGAVATPCASAALTVGGTCNESVTFTPKYPGLRLGAVVLLDASGNILGTAYLSGVGQGGLDVLTPGNIIEFAGVLKQVSSTQNGVPATSTDLKQPASVALDGAGNLYIADSAHNEVRMVCFGTNSATISGISCPGAGIIEDVAGTGNAGYLGFGVHSTSGAVELNAPSGLAVDGAGNLYIADTGNNVIREISASTGIINTVAGDSTLGYGGDGLKATAAGVELNSPQGVTIDAAGNLYIADTSNQRIRRVDAVTGIITTAVGDGDPSGLGNGKGTYSGNGGPANAAGLSLPYAVAFDVAGDMYIPDSGNNVIRFVKATSGVLSATSAISTLIGTPTAFPSCANGPTSGAGLNSPEAVALDAAGNVYISDTANNCVRKTNVTSGEITTIAIQSYYEIDTAGTPYGAEIYEPVGLAMDGLGNIYFADYYFMVVSEIQSDKAVLNYQATPIRQGQQSAPQTQVVENDGNATSSITSLTPDINAVVDAATTTCAPNPFTLAQDADCNVGAIFAPSLTINPATLPGTVIGNIDVANDTVNALLDIVLIGDATAVNSTSITLTSTPNPSEFGKAVTFTATVTSGTTGLTGQVTFSDTIGGVTTQLAQVGVNASGVATYVTSKLVVGVHTISASYGGDASHLASSAPATGTQTVFEATKTALTAVPKSPSTLGASVTFTATISVTDGGAFPLDGSVTFTDSLTPLANNTVNIVGGVATYTTTALVGGVNVITAIYTPNTTNLIQGSQAVLNQDVVSPSTATLTSAPNPSMYGSPVTFTVILPTIGTVAATGKVSIAIVPVGLAAPIYPLTVTLAGNPATGSANISTLPVGSYNATATYAGDSNYGATTASLAAPQVVSQVSTTTTVTAVPNPGIAGKPVAITATVAPASGTVAPTGTVTFTYTLAGVTTTLGAGPITLVKGVATVNATLAAGTYPIVATYSGDSDDGAGTPGTLSLVVNAATTTTKVTATPAAATVGGTITFSAVVTGTGPTATGTVTFVATGTGATVNLPTGTLDGTGKTSVTYSTLPAGSYTITATYSGDADNGTSSGTTTVTVGLIPTTTDLTAGVGTGADPSSILIAIVQNSGSAGATPVPTGTVTFTSGATTGTATLDANGVATWTPTNLGSGSYTFTAAYGGDSLHSPSQGTASVSITAAGPSFTLTVPPTMSIATTQNATVTVSLQSISGFTDTIGLGCASLPVGVNCHFSTLSVPLAANATATSQLTIDTNNPLGGGASAMNKPSGNRNIAMAGLLFPFSLCLGWILWRFRRRHARVWSMVLILVLSGAALLASGCGGFTQSSAAPGTYTFYVVGVGSNTGVSQSQAVKLTITQ